MAAGFLISFREGLEAALIVGVLLGYLRKIGRWDRQRDIWMGVVLAVFMSVALAWGIQRVGIVLEGRLEEIYEGTMMFLAVIVLTWVIYWMRNQIRMIRSTLELDLQDALDRNNSFRLAMVAFVAVFREGIETALFLSAALFAVQSGGTLAGAVLGILAAAALGFLIYAASIRLDMKWFFRVTSGLLLIFAAGLFAHGIHEFQEAALLPVYYEHLWDVNHILSEESVLGRLLQALAGYNGNPSLVEVLGYLAYWLFALLGIPWFIERSKMSEKQIPQPN
jgi:high-affinity iron transporter